MHFFDGHNDLLYRMWQCDNDPPHAGAMARGYASADGHLDLTRASAAGFTGGLFALFIPNSAAGEELSGGQPPSYEAASIICTDMLALVDELVARFGDNIAKCLTVSDILAAHDARKIAMVLHIEGAEMISADCHEIEMLYQRGIRSLGPLWSRPNRFGEGVPLQFPGFPDQGSGLSDAGKRLVRTCNQYGIMLDLSHLNEKGFWDVAKLTDKPLVATHSNVHRLCPSPRNLTDRQLDAIAETGGLVGLCFATSYLRKDGEKNPDTSLALLVQHCDALIETLGEGGVALGSDFDGACIPDAIGDCTGMPALEGALRQAGYDDALLHRLFSQNWLDMLSRQIG